MILHLPHSKQQHKNWSTSPRHIHKQVCRPSDKIEGQANNLQFQLFLHKNQMEKHNNKERYKILWESTSRSLCNNPSSQFHLRKQLHSRQNRKFSRSNHKLHHVLLLLQCKILWRLLDPHKFRKLPAIVIHNHDQIKIQFKSNYKSKRTVTDKLRLTEQFPRRRQNCGIFSGDCAEQSLFFLHNSPPPTHGPECKTDTPTA